MIALRKQIFLSLILLLGCCSVFGQGEGNVWYFGQNAGIDFNGGAPVARTDGALITEEGCATISNFLGEILFYTDGVKVWDSTHTIMPNGLALDGNSSSSQSGIIVPKPGSNTDYYIFTVDQLGGADGLKYSEVDLSLNGGLGDVTTKNVSLIAPSCEKITAINHSNLFHFWVIAHEWGSNAYYAYRVTDTGVDPTPVISNVGTAHFGAVSNSAGYMKVAPTADRLAVAIRDESTFEVFDFDNSTGMLSNPITLTSPDFFAAYGVEFSLDGTKLYGAIETGAIYQWEVDAGSAAAVNASETLIATSSGTIGALQLGPDERIYVSRFNRNWLGVIENPNDPGASVTYLDNGVNLGSQFAQYGLPSFIQTFFNVPELSHLNDCQLDTTYFEMTNVTNLDSVEWNFGDPGSGSANTSRDSLPWHIYADTGTYQVFLVYYYKGAFDTLFYSLTIEGPPEIELGPGFRLCEDEVTIIDATYEASTYLWNDGWGGPRRQVEFPGGLYEVTVTNRCGNDSDSLRAEYFLNPEISLGPDTILCHDSVLTLSVPEGFDHYQWGHGPTERSVTVDKEADYTITVTDSIGCQAWAKMFLQKKYCLRTLMVPNAFTPNGDGINDDFVIYEKEGKLIDLKIFSRWGALVYQAGSVEFPWDGSYNGKKVPEGVYAWSILYKDSEEKNQQLKGTVNILK